jgi:CDP-paratose 2-epimerase
VHGATSFADIAVVKYGLYCDITLGNYCGGKERKKMTILITGGCGFIGSNATEYFSKLGHDIIVVDNLSRPGALEHARFVQELPRTRLIVADLIMEDSKWINAVQALKEKDAILHLAGQVAVTTSVADPISDFRGNVLSTLNLLEVVRRSGKRPAVIFSSTNKVYGELDWLDLSENEKRYTGDVISKGLDEKTPLDFHSPYGCSKGAADQYVRDYARIYGLRTVVFRQSCIYGPRQFGVEDQGWLAWFTIAALLGRPVTIYGTGKQVRDVLFVDDLNRAFASAMSCIDQAAGKIFNIGGGPQNTLSLLELLETLDRFFGLKTKCRFVPPRVGDQKVFVSDINKAEKDLDWQPQVGLHKGLASMYEWCGKNLGIIRKLIE